MHDRLDLEDVADSTVTAGASVLSK